MSFRSRRGFMQGAAALPLALRAMAQGNAHGELLLVGTQTSGTSKGIYAYELNAASGELRQLGVAGEAANPTFLALAPNGKDVFAVNEIDSFADKNSGSLSAFRLDRVAAKLRLVNQVATGGGSPCHVAVDHTGTCVFVANYVGGSAASFRLEEGGKLSKAVSLFQYRGSGPDKARQTSPHAHRVTVSPDNRFVMVNDLGLDVIHVYRLDPRTGVMTPNDPPTWKAAPGSGPRALQFHPNGRWAYCVTEMSSTVYVLRWDAVGGILETVQELAMLPQGYHGETAGNDIVLDRAGRFAYASNRLDDFLATFDVAPEDGRLTLARRSSCGGKTPRHLALDKTGRWLLVANQLSDNLAVFARDATTGKLADAGKIFPLSRPQCVLFV